MKEKLDTKINIINAFYFDENLNVPNLTKLESIKIYMNNISEENAKILFNRRLKKLDSFEEIFYYTRLGFLHLGKTLSIHDANYKMLINKPITIETFKKLWNIKFFHSYDYVKKCYTSKLIDHFIKICIGDISNKMLTEKLIIFKNDRVYYDYHGIHIEAKLNILLTKEFYKTLLINYPLEENSLIKKLISYKTCTIDIFNEMLKHHGDKNKMVRDYLRKTYRTNNINIVKQLDQNGYIKNNIDMFYNVTNKKTIEYIIGKDYISPICYYNVNAYEKSEADEILNKINNNIDPFEDDNVGKIKLMNTMKPNLLFKYIGVLCGDNKRKLFKLYDFFINYHEITLVKESQIFVFYNRFKTILNEENNLTNTVTVNIVLMAKFCANILVKFNIKYNIDGVINIINIFNERSPDTKVWFSYFMSKEFEDMDPHKRIAYKRVMVINNINVKNVMKVDLPLSKIYEYHENHIHRKDIRDNSLLHLLIKES